MYMFGCIVIARDFSLHIAHVFSSMTLRTEFVVR